MTVTAAEVIEDVETLEHDYSVFRLEMSDREKLYGMYKLPQLPKDLARSEAVYILSPDLIHESKGIRSFMLQMQTEIMVIPTAREPGSGTVPRGDKRKADNLEKVDAMWWTNINPDRHLESMVIWRQMIHPLAVVVLECGPIESLDPSKRFPWRAFDIDLDGCGWLEHQGIPTVFGRHYNQLMLDCMTNFSRRRDGPNAGADLYYERGKWEFKPASDDYSPRTNRAASNGKGFSQAEMMWRDNGETFAYVGPNAKEARWQIGPFGFGQKEARSGQLLWEGPNPFGRVSAFLIPGNRTALRKPQDAYEPFLQELATTIEQENMVDSIRATGSRNKAAPRDYMHADPESMAEYLRLNNGQLPPPYEWADGKTPTFMGEIKERPSTIDPDLDKLEAKLAARRERYTPASLSTLRDPEVLKQTTAAAYLGALDSGTQYLSSPIGSFDVAKRQMIEAFHHSVKFFAREHGPRFAEFAITAAGTGVSTKGKSLRPEEQASISPEALDFPHRIIISTRTQTQAQAEARYSLAYERFKPLPDGRPGIGVYDDLYEAINESDPTARKSTIAKELVKAAFVQPFLQAQAEAVAAEFVELNTGIVLPGSAAAGAPPPAPAGPAPAGLSGRPGGHTNSPSTEPVSGGSGPVIA